MKQLKDINGRLRTCTRCKSGAPAVFKKSGEWLCEECLAKRKARQAADAAKPKCHKCNGQAMHGEIWCNNHAPEFDPVAELERLEKELAEARVEINRRDELCKKCEREYEAELDRYKQGVEVEVTVDSYDYGDTYFICEDIKLPSEFRGQRVRVLVMPMEDKNE